PLAGIAARAGIAVVAGGRVDDRLTRAHAARAGIAAGTGVAVLARGAVRRCRAGAGPARTGVVARARVLVVARRAVEQRGVAGAGAVLAGVGRGALVGVIALARRGTADPPGRRVAVGGTSVAHAVAALGHVAGAGRRPADRAGIARRVLAG